MSSSQPTTPRPYTSSSVLPVTYTTPPSSAGSPSQAPHGDVDIDADDQQQEEQEGSGYHCQKQILRVRPNFPPPPPLKTKTNPRGKELLYFGGSPAFGPSQYHNNVFALNRITMLQVDLQARIERGFFMAENGWTCYRRNYFQLSGAFVLREIGTVYADQDLPCLVQHQGGLHPIQCFKLGIGARATTSNVAIPLIQHTPKRDKGPQITPEPRLIRPGGIFPTNPDNNPPFSVVAFERIQFKTATPNNGKRRAAQQYYKIVACLFAQLTSGELVVVCTTDSPNLVVRGRSPGHYTETCSYQQQGPVMPPQQQTNTQSHDSHGMAYLHSVSHTHQRTNQDPTTAATTGAGYSTSPTTYAYPGYSYRIPHPSGGGDGGVSLHEHMCPPYQHSGSSSSSGFDPYDYEHQQHPSRYSLPLPDQWPRQSSVSNASNTTAEHHSYSPQSAIPCYEPPRLGGGHPSLPPLLEQQHAVTATYHHQHHPSSDGSSHMQPQRPMVLEAPPSPKRKQEPASMPMAASEAGAGTLPTLLNKKQRTDGKSTAKKRVSTTRASNRRRKS